MNKLNGRTGNILIESVFVVPSKINARSADFPLLGFLKHIYFCENEKGISSVLT